MAWAAWTWEVWEVWELWVGEVGVGGGVSTPSVTARGSERVSRGARRCAPRARHTAEAPAVLALSAQRVSMALHRARWWVVGAVGVVGVVRWW